MKWYLWSLLLQGQMNIIIFFGIVFVVVKRCLEQERSFLLLFFLYWFYKTRKYICDLDFSTFDKSNIDKNNYFVLLDTKSGINQMLNRQWFYLTVCGNNSFTYVFHKCDPIPSQGRYKPTLSIEYNLQRFSHTKRVDELSYKRHPVLGTNNSSHSFLKNDYRTTTERSRPGWCLLWEWIQIGNHFTRSFKLL